MKPFERGLFGADLVGSRQPASGLSPCVLKHCAQLTEDTPSSARKARAVLYDPWNHL